jgi:exosortase
VIKIILPILSGVIVLWTSLRWYWFRIFDGTEESQSALALLTAVLFIAHSKLEYFDRVSAKEQNSNWVLPTLLTVIYTALLPIAAKPVLGILMVLIVGAIANSSGALAKEKMVATLAMLLLALPLTPAFNFYCQWPLQVFIAQGAAAIFALYGIPLEVKGASVFFAGKLIAIDAACSGLHFLWFSLYLAVLIAYFKKAGALRVVGTLMIALAAALIANLVRVLILTFCFIIGLSGLANNSIFHQAVGVLAFVLVSCFIFLSFDIRIRIALSPLGSSFTQHALSWLRLPFNKLQISQLGYFVVCLISALVAATVGHDSFAYRKTQETWPKEFEGHLLVPVALSSQEKAFEENFPGSIAKFSDGKGEVIFRKVYSPTRQLHPISECLRATGFRIEQESLSEDRKGIYWNRSTAVMGERKLDVEERITDLTGGTWPSVSQWYWAAILGQTKGPWLSITKARIATLAGQ